MKVWVVLFFDGDDASVRGVFKGYVTAIKDATRFVKSYGGDWNLEEDCWAYSNMKVWIEECELD